MLVQNASGLVAPSPKHDEVSPKAQGKLEIWPETSKLLNRAPNGLVILTSYSNGSHGQKGGSNTGDQLHPESGF